MEFEAKRQAVLNKRGEKVGYEFFLVYYGRESFPRETITNRSTFITVRTLAEYGLKRVGEDLRVFLRIPIDSLLVRVYELLHAEAMVYRVHLPSVGMGKTVYTKASDAIEKLRKAGALISIHYKLLHQYPSLKEIADIAEVPANEVNLTELSSLREKRLLITRVETERTFKKFQELGDYFQGDYIEKPQTLTSFKLAPFLKSTLLRLLVLMNTAQSPTEFAKVIETDVGITAKLLRFINSAYFSLRKEIKSVEQATIFFGIKNLRNFIIVLSMNDYTSVVNPLLWKKSLIRAKLMEEFAKYKAPELTGEAYLVGLFSLIDLILEVEITDFLKEVRVDENILKAFENEDSPLAYLLSFVTVLEEESEKIMSSEKPLDNPTLREISERIGIKGERVLDMVKNSYLMADTIIHL